MPIDKAWMLFDGACWMVFDGGRVRRLFDGASAGRCFAQTSLKVVCSDREVILGNHKQLGGGPKVIPGPNTPHGGGRGTTDFDRFPI